MLALNWLDPSGGRGGNFERVEWRPTTGHLNKARPLSVEFIEGSHLHPLALNATLHMGLLAAIRSNLPAAERLPNEPPDWAGLVQDAALRWHIVGLVAAEAPLWQTPLL
jgi:hypothetical protein